MGLYRLAVVVLMAGSLFLGGCKHCCKKNSPNDCNSGTLGPPGPTGGPPTLPPQGIPVGPPPQSRSNLQPEILLPTTPPPGRNQPIVPPARTQAPAPPSQPLPPSPPAAPRPTLGEPDFNTPAAAVDEAKPAPKPASPEPPIDGGLSSVMPAGIAGFAQVKGQVTTGMRPHLDGLDWLRSHNYKTVLYLHDLSEQDSSDRKQVEQRGMAYQGLVVTSQTIQSGIVNDFIRTVNNVPGRPLFVYDLDGKRAGVMWYLYFRYSERLDDEEARRRASRYGLKENGDAEQTQLWTAVQKYLADNKP